MPSVVNPKGRKRRLQAILETWGPDARAIFVSHNQTHEFPQGVHLTLSDNKTPRDPYSYPQTLVVPEHINEAAGVPRLYHTIQTIFEKVNPDFTFFVNDHTFVIPEHLCTFLEGQDPAQDMYAGHALRNQKDVFNSGASGYVLSRETMKKLINTWEHHRIQKENNLDYDDSCWVGSDASAWLQGNPGLVTVKCLQSLGIRAIDTRAAKKYHRFHAFSLTRTVSGKVDQWYNNKHMEMDTHDGFDESYNTLLPGEDCCAEDSVSFHYVEAAECQALYAARQALMDFPEMPDAELEAILIQTWPRGKEVGFYSAPLPAPDDSENWNPLVKTIRKISRPVSQSQSAECY